MNDVEIQVPANAVFHPLSSDYRTALSYQHQRPGLGQCDQEALFHGLAEVIERDAWALVETDAQHGAAHK